MKIPEYHQSANDDAPTGALTDNQSPDTSQSAAPLKERGPSGSIVAEHVAAKAAGRVLADENLSAEEIADQSAYAGPEVDVGQQAAHAELARSEATPRNPTE
jgi:hypothetical protein